MFTGDRSGDWLYRSLHAFGFANQAVSVSREDGLRLHDCYVTAACRCAPPDNKPTREELLTCRAFLHEELRLLRNARVVVGLGRIGHHAAYQALKSLGRSETRVAPPFAHGTEAELTSGLSLLASFHPSQQNTFTGRLTRPMFDRIFRRARSILAL